MAKDQTVVGITGKPIPKPRTAKQQYELEKKRRMEKHLGKNVGGTQYRSDVTPYYNPRARTFEEFMGICEAVYGGEKKEPKDDRYTVTAADKKANTLAYQKYKAGDKKYKAASHLGEDSELEEAKTPVTRQAGDFRYSGRTGEEKAERRANVLSKSEDPKKRRQANTIRSKIKTVADRDTARASSDARQKLYRGQQRRANDLARQLMSKEEVELDEVVVTRSPEVKQRAKNIKKIRDKKDALAALMQHAKLQKQGLADEVEYNGENVDEVLMVTPSAKKPTKKVVKSVTKLEKPNPNDPDYVKKHREYLKAKQRQEAVDYERMSSGARAATERAATAKKAKLQRQQSDAEAARTAFRTKGVPFSDAKGSGHIVNGKKVYAS